MPKKLHPIELVKKHKSYWLGRLHEKMGNPKSKEEFFIEAIKYFKNY